MQQISIFDILEKNDKTLKNLKCYTKQQLSKKNKALKAGYEVGTIVSLDDDSTEYKIHYLFWGCDGELKACLENHSTMMNWDISSNRLHIKK